MFGCKSLWPSPLLRQEPTLAFLAFKDPSSHVLATMSFFIPSHSKPCFLQRGTQQTAESLLPFFS